MRVIPSSLGTRVALGVIVLGPWQAILAQTEASAAPNIIRRIQPMRQLTFLENAVINHPTVCKDGTIVFTRKGQDLSDRSDRWRLWSVPISGGEVRPITPVDFPEDATRPACAPDGKTVAFAVGANRGQSIEEAQYDPGLRRAIWTLDLPSGRMTIVTDKTGASDLSSSWLPDGKSFAVRRETLAKATDGDTDQWIVTLDGKESPLVSWESYEGAGDISSDGRLFLFGSDRGLDEPRRLRLWILDVERGIESARLVWPNWDGKTFMPDWSPDGQ